LANYRKSTRLIAASKPREKYLRRGVRDNMPKVVHQLRDWLATGMNAESILAAIAAIGVSLAGFAGIVGALAGEKLRPAEPGLWLPFWVMISSGLGIVFAALFPFLPHHLGAPDHVSWAAASAFVTVLTSCSLAFFTPRFLEARRHGFIAGTLAFDFLLYLLSFILLVSQLLNTLGVGLPQSAGGFLAGLYLMLLISALNFVYLLYVLAYPRRGPPAA
jgi:hypothetical protein